MRERDNWVWIEEGLHFENNVELDSHLFQLIELSLLKQSTANLLLHLTTQNTFWVLLKLSDKSSLWKKTEQ